MEEKRSKLESCIRVVKEMENDHNRPAKRKRVVLTLEEKLKVIAEKEKGISYEAVANRFNIGTTTVKDIVRRKDIIQQAILKDKQFGLQRKVLQEGRKPKVEEKLYAYVIERTEQGEVVTNRDLIETTTNLTKEIYNEDWKPSVGWLKKFKTRYSLNTTSMNDSSIIEEDELEDDIFLTIEEQSSSEICNNDEEEEENEEEVPSNATISVTTACDILIDYMSEHNFPLKEIITVRVIKEKISQMPEGQTCYEVLQEQKKSTQDPLQDLKFEIVEEESGHTI